MKSAKQITFELLDRCQPGQRFSGYGLRAEVNRRTGQHHYPDTMLRYMREWRKTTGREIRNIDRAKSIYEVIE